MIVVTVVVVISSILLFIGLLDPNAAIHCIEGNFVLLFGPNNACFHFGVEFFSSLCFLSFFLSLSLSSLLFVLPSVFFSLVQGLKLLLVQLQRERGNSRFCHPKLLSV